jgi:hypothetical protein
MALTDMARTPTTRAITGGKGGWVRVGIAKKENPAGLRRFVSETCGVGHDNNLAKVWNRRFLNLRKVEEIIT